MKQNSEKRRDLTLRQRRPKKGEGTECVTPNYFSWLVKKVMCMTFLFILSIPAFGAECPPDKCPCPITARVVGGAPQFDAEDKSITIPIPGNGNFDVRITNNATWPVSINGYSIDPNRAGQGITSTFATELPIPLAGIGVAQQTQWDFVVKPEAQPGAYPYVFKVLYYYVHPTLHCDCSGWATVDPTVILPPVPIGYNTIWLVLTIMFLILSGGYLILRRRRKIGLRQQ